MNQRKNDPMTPEKLAHLQVTPIPWYEAANITRLVWALVPFAVLIVSLVLAVDEETAKTTVMAFVEPLLAIIGSASVIWGLFARTRLPTPPVSLTRAKALKHETMQVVDTPKEMKNAA